MKIYFLLSKTGTVLSRTIRIFTRYPYNHLSFGFSPGLNELYSIGRRYPRNPFSGGFVIENIHEGLYKIKKNTECRVFTLDIKENQHRKMQKELERFLAEPRKYSYNTSGLIRNHVKKGKKRKEHRYFCTEFAAEILRKSGIHDFGMPDEHVKPSDFLKIPGIKIIYEGRLNEYRKK